MIRLIGTMASLAWLAFMMWGAMREYRAANPRVGSSAPATRLVVEQLTGWLARRARPTRPRHGPEPPSA